MTAEHSEVTRRTHGRPRSPHSLRLLTLAVASLAAGHAQAYLDPGSGSMLLQVILGGFAAAGVAIKLYWHRIKAAMGLGRKAEAEDDSSPSE